MFEVSVPVPPDLPGIRVPVATGSDPAENEHLPAEIGDRPKIGVFTIAAAILIDAAPVVAIFEDLAPTVRLQKWRLSDVLNSHSGSVRARRSLEPIEVDGVRVFSMRFENIGRWGNGK